MRYTYIIIDDSTETTDETSHMLERFQDFYAVGVAQNRSEAVDLILDLRPTVVFVNLNPVNAKSEISLSIISELHQFLDELPLFVVMSPNEKRAYDAIKVGVFDYLLYPLQSPDLVKCILKLKKAAPAHKRKVYYEPEYKPQAAKQDHPQEIEVEKDSDQICIKSYGDYQFVSLNDIIYLQADNNTTDFHLSSGRKLTAYKTLKHYESVLPPHFYRIHNSYIVNSSHITRISTGKSLCYLQDNKVSIPFSKTYKQNIDAIIRQISSEYL